MMKRPKMKWVETADTACANLMIKWIDEGAKLTYMGNMYVALAEGGFSYMGDVLRAHHPDKGLFVVILNGHNCRSWGTDHGRLEMPHGSKADAGVRDPAPGVMAPWHKLCELVLITNNWKPRKCAAFDNLMEKLHEAR
jgi:hypothetical protein